MQEHLVGALALVNTRSHAAQRVFNILMLAYGAPAALTRHVRRLAPMSICVSA